MVVEESVVMDCKFDEHVCTNACALVNSRNGSRNNY